VNCELRTGSTSVLSCESKNGGCQNESRKKMKTYRKSQNSMFLLRKGVAALMVVVILAVGVVAQGTIVDADAFADGTDISNAFTGITLSAIDFSNCDGKVYAETDSLASTGSNVFGNSSTAFYNEWHEDDNNFSSCPALKVVFDSSVLSVTIDAIGNNGSDYGRLKAYSSSGTLLDTYDTSQLITGTVETMSISRSSADIGYIIAGGAEDHGDTVHLDNLNYVVPEPATVALLGLGSLALIRRRRR